MNGDSDVFARVRAALVAARAGPPLVAAPADGPRPCSFMEGRLWFLEQLHPETNAYHESNAYAMDGDLDAAALTRAFAAVVERHAILRTVFRREEDAPVAAVAAPAPQLARTDLTAVAESARASVAQEHARAHAAAPFDLQHGPLLRATLLRFAADAHVLLLSTHHIVWDHESLRLFLEELACAYAANSASSASNAAPAAAGAPIGEPRLQYGDFARWQRARATPAALAPLMHYWQQRFASPPPVLEFRSDWPRPDVPTFRGRTLWFTVPAALRQGLAELARRDGSTPFAALLTGLAVALWRVTGTEDLVVGTPMSQRTRPELLPLLGALTNTLPLRIDLTGRPSAREALARVHASIAAAQARGDLPFERIVEAARPTRATDRTPLLQVMFSLHREAAASVALPGVQLAPIEFELGNARFDLELHLWHDDGGGLRGKFVAAAELFTDAALGILQDALVRLLAAMVAQPDATIGSLPWLSAAERERVLRLGRGGEHALPEPALLPRLFAARVLQQPQAIAVTGGESLTYAEVHARARRLAQRLRALGVRPDDVLGVSADRTPATIVAMLAIVAAGGAYLPLDRALPAERLAFLLRDARVELVVGDAAARAPWDALGVRFVAIDAGGVGDETSGAPALTPDHLAYVVYTSGSTGVPKGVMVSHRAVAHLALANDYAGITAEDRVAQASDLSFDATTFEVWGTLLHGATLVLLPRDTLLAPRALAAFLRAQRISVLFLTTAMFHAAVDVEPATFATLRCLLVGGEVVDPRRMRTVLAQGGPARLVVVYGPTENTVFSTFHPVADRAACEGRLPIGRPIANTDAVILDDELRLVARGAPGELCLAGLGLARGYLGARELTDAAFVRNPLPEIRGDRLYRTGDRARWRADGTLDFLGRTDRQVKVRGFRVELTEIEHVLSQHPLVQQAVVTHATITGATEGLVAFVLPAASEVPAAADLRAYLRRRLPEYMLPGTFVPVEAIPLTTRGKVDTRALLMLAGGRRAEPAAGRPPSTLLEQRLARVWRQVLWLDRDVGLDEDFFDLGGHSLLAVALVAAVEKELQINLPVAALFELRTVGALGAFLGGRREPKTSARLADSAGRRGVVMILDASVPYPDRDAGSHRMFEVVRLLRELGFDVIFVPDNDAAAEPYTGNLRALGVDVLLTTYHAGGVTRPLAEHVEAALSAVDVAWICKPPQFERWAPVVRRHPGVRVVYDTCDLHFVRLQRAAKLTNTADQANAPWRAMHAREMAIVASADISITVTSVERDTLLAHAPRGAAPRVVVVPSVHRPAPPAATTLAERAGVLFIGSYAHAPNVDAAMWLCETVMPLVWRTQPGLRVTLLGSNPTAVVKSLAGDRVAVPGFVADVGPYYASHRVCVAPLLYGAGIKGKVAQALEHALPLVSTSIGIEGMDLHDERDVLVAETAEAFARAIVRLCRDDALWLRLSARAHACLTPLAPVAVAATLDAMLQTLLQDRAAGQRVAT